MRERAITQLDDASAELAELLRTADRLLDEWSRFGDAVRAQVDREAATVGTAVAGAVDAAVARAVASQLATVGTEIQRLEQRVRAAARAVAVQESQQRWWLYGIAGGVAVAIALLVALVVLNLRPPTEESMRLDPAVVITPESGR
jgi:Mg/Co/Ni transporter MgtE